MKRASTVARLTDSLALIVDRIGESMWSDRKGREFVDDLAFLPDHRLKLDYLGRVYAGWVGRSILGYSNNLASVVHRISFAERTTKRADVCNSVVTGLLILSL